MCLHLTKAGVQCQKNPEMDLCGTHTLNLQYEQATEENLKRFVEHLNRGVTIDPHDTLVRVPKTVGRRHFLMTKDSKFTLASHLMIEVARNTPTVARDRHPRVTMFNEHGVVCGNCRKAGVEDPRHDNPAEVRACYEGRL